MEELRAAEKKAKQEAFAAKLRKPTSLNVPSQNGNTTSENGNSVSNNGEAPISPKPTLRRAVSINAKPEALSDAEKAEKLRLAEEEKKKEEEEKRKRRRRRV